MSDQRVQFYPPRNRSLAGGGLHKPVYDGWPDLSGKRACSRAALRLLHAHALRPEGTEWVVVRGDTVVETVELTMPTSTASSNWDILVNRGDLNRLQDLIDKKVASSRPAAMRIALHFLCEIDKKLTRGAKLAQQSDDDGLTVPVDLAMLLVVGRESVSPSATPDVLVPIAQARSPTRLEALHPRFSPETEELAVVMIFVTSFSRFLAAKVDKVTLRAQQTEPAGTESTRVRTKHETEADEALAEEWRRELELTNLLKEFVDGEAERRASGTTLLSAEVAGSTLFSGRWRDRLHDIDERAHIGAEAVRSYLESRIANLRPWGLHDENAERRWNWRFWTRSKHQAGHREISSPIEWNGVLHHWMSVPTVRWPQRSKATAAHDLQTLLNRAFGASNRRHALALSDSCMAFNQLFYGHPVAPADRALGAHDALCTLRETIDALQTIAPSSLGDAERWPQEDASDSPRTLAQEREDLARLCFVHLVLMRVIRPVFRWEVCEGANAVRRREPHLPSDIKLGIRSLAYADFSELRARVFGAQTTIAGLSEVLRGGLVPRSQLGRAWLVCGEAGSGKSTFGLALAADIARRGRICIVICSDEHAETVRERLVMFGLRDDRCYDVVDRDRFEELLRSEEPEAETAPRRRSKGQRVKGMLVIFGAGRGTSQPVGVPEQLELGSWLQEVSEHARRHGRRLRELSRKAARKAQQTASDERLLELQRRWSWMSVLIDSIDTLQVAGGGTPAREDQVVMARLMQTIELSRVWAILLCGKENPHRVALSYLADTVIELDTHDAGLQRRMQIMKCRTQEYEPGHHELRLVQGIGVIVHPNLTAAQRAVRRTTRRMLDVEQDVRLPSRIFWPGSSDDSAAQAPSDVLRIQRGSTVLLYGPAGSGKSPLLLNLVSQRMSLTAYPQWRLGATGSVLIVSFLGSGREVLRPLEACRPLSDQWRDNVSDVQLQWYGPDNTMRAAQVAHDLLRRIQRLRREAVPLDWIVFLGVESLRANLPAVDAERSFWPTILATTAIEQITTAFVVTGSDQTFQHRQEMDYVLRFAQGAGSHDRTITVEKSATPPPSGGSPELLLDLRAGTLAPRPTAR